MKVLCYNFCCFVVTGVAWTLAWYQPIGNDRSMAYPAGPDWGIPKLDHGIA